MNECRKLCSDSWKVMCFILYSDTEWIWEIICFMLFALTCSTVFWVADYLRLPEILSYPWRAVCEDRQCSLNCCSNESHILAWAWWHCQEDLSCIIHWILACSQFTWSDIWLSVYHTHSSKDSNQEASWCRMTFIHHLYHNLLSWMMNDHHTISCRDFLLMKQIQDWWLTLLNEFSCLLKVLVYILVMKLII